MRKILFSFFISVIVHRVKSVPLSHTHCSTSRTMWNSHNAAWEKGHCGREFSQRAQICKLLWCPGIDSWGGIFKLLGKQFQGIDSVSLCSLAGWYDNSIPTRFLVLIDCSKITALGFLKFYKFGLRDNNVVMYSTSIYSKCYARKLKIKLCHWRKHCLYNFRGVNM